MARGLRFFFDRLFRRERLDREMEEEIRAHLELRAADLEKSGLCSEKARRHARLEFGGVEGYKERSRETRRFHVLHDLVADISYAARMLRKSPGFTAVAVITLALGIGANTAISSYMFAWILRPLSYPESDRLLVVGRQNLKAGWMSSSVPFADFLDWQGQNHAFEQLAGWNTTAFTVVTDGPPQRPAGSRVSWNFFQTLRARPAKGRWFLPEDDRPGAGDVVILSEGFWETQFGADPQIVGRSILMNQRPYTVIGVMPADFHFPLAGATDVWVPLALSDSARADRKAGIVEVVGRLNPGVTLADAAAELDAIAARLARDFPDTNANTTVHLDSLRDTIGKRAGAAQLWIVFSIVWLILLIACANVANLALARASHRTQEMAVRAAVGAGRSRLMRQLLTENVVLFLLGGVAGLIAARLGLEWIYSIIPENSRAEMPNFGHVTLEWDVFLYTFGTAFACAILFGFLPALLSSKVDLNAALKDASSQSLGSAHRGRMRAALVVGEIALALVVVICSALLIETFILMVPANPGFEARNLTVLRVDLPAQKYRTPDQRRAFCDQLLTRIAAAPQVSDVAAAQVLPFTGSWWYGVEPLGQPVDSRQPPGAAFFAVTPQYFRTMKIPLLRGRGFSSQDDASAPPVAIVDETMARRFWPQGDALGSQFRLATREPDKVFTVVGIVRNVRLRPRTAEMPEPEMYVPFAQLPTEGISLGIRSSASPSALAEALRNAVWAEDRYQPITFIRPMEEIFQRRNANYRAMAQVVGFFSVLALLLGAVGIYGVTSYTVAQRRHEIGIRIALGAGRRTVLGLVLGHGMKLAAIGIVLGVLGALGAARLIAFMLYGVGASDVPTFLSTALLLGAVAALASYVPALRATKVDPMVALRYE